VVAPEKRQFPAVQNRSDPKTGTSFQFSLRSSLLRREVRHHGGNRLSLSPRQFVALIRRAHPSSQSRSSRPISLGRTTWVQRAAADATESRYSADPGVSGGNRRFKGTRCHASFCRPSSTSVARSIVSQSGRRTARTGPLVAATRGLSQTVVFRSRRYGPLPGRPDDDITRASCSVL
jgi:hypothetical protein